MMQSKKRNILIGGLLATILIMGIAYAAFSSSLTITGTGSTTKNWGVKITSIEPTNPSMDANCSDRSDSSTCTTTGNITARKIDDLSATFSAALISPGDFVTYTITVQNFGDLDAKLDSITMPVSSNPAISFSRGGLDEGDVITAGGSDTLTVTVTYVNSENQGQPASTLSNFTLALNFVQDDGNGGSGGTTKYSVTYDCTTNGGADCSSHNTSLAQGASVNLSYTEESAGNNSFIGWNTDSTATTGLSSLTMPAGNITLYAIYGSSAAPQNAPVINSVNTTKTSTSVTAVASASADGGTITKYEFKLYGEDGTFDNDIAFVYDNKYTVEEKIRLAANKEVAISTSDPNVISTDWIDNGTNNTYTFTNLQKGNEYIIQVRVTGSNGLTTTSESINVTPGISAPTFTYGASAITITFPDGCSSPYTCKYKKDNGSEVTVSTNTVEVQYTNSVALIATVSDGVETISNTFTASAQNQVASGSGSGSGGPIELPTSYSVSTTPRSITVKVDDSSIDKTYIYGYRYYIDNYNYSDMTQDSQYTFGGDGYYGNDLYIGSTYTIKVEACIAQHECYQIGKEMQVTTDVPEMPKSYSTTTTTQSITVTVNDASVDLSDIDYYEYCIDNSNCDSPSINSPGNNSNIFTSLSSNSTYTIEVKGCYYGQGGNLVCLPIGTATQVTTDSIPVPTFEMQYNSPYEGEVTITYPDGCGNAYNCSYTVYDAYGGWQGYNSVYSTTETVNVNQSGEIVAYVESRSNSSDAVSSTFTVTLQEPASGSGSGSGSIAASGSGSGSGSGIAAPDGTIYAFNTNTVSIGAPYYGSYETDYTDLNKSVFNKYVISGGVITEASSCTTFGISGFLPECVQGSTDGSTYGYDAGGNHTGNVALLKALEQNQDFIDAGGSCDLGSGDSSCYVGNLTLSARSGGYVSANDYGTRAYCSVGNSGSAGCAE